MRRGVVGSVAPQRADRRRAGFSRRCLSRRVAHDGARPMAPVASYILGLALGAPGADPTAAMARLQEAIATAPLPEED